MVTASLRRAFFWIAYFAFCFSLVWAIETFSKVRGSDNLAVCFFYITVACERLASTSTSAYPLFHPLLSWMMLLGLIGVLLMSLAPRGGEGATSTA